jgi:hypothetical protein
MLSLGCSKHQTNKITCINERIKTTVKIIQNTVNTSTHSQQVHILHQIYIYMFTTGTDITSNIYVSI